MKKIIASLFLTFSFYVFSQDDSVKVKKLDFLIETGFGISTGHSNNYTDGVSLLISANRQRIGLGVFYNLSKQWKIYSTFEYYKINVHNAIILQEFNHPKYMKHKLDNMKWTGILYRQLIRDEKSSLYVGLGFSANKHLNKISISKAYQLKINNETVEATFTSKPPSNSFGSVDFGLMYCYSMKKMDIGFKIDFTSYGGYLIPYTYSVQNHFEHKEYYSPNGFNMESSIFLKF